MACVFSGKNREILGIGLRSFIELLKQLFAKSLVKSRE